MYLITLYDEHVFNFHYKTKCEDFWGIKYVKVSRSWYYNLNEEEENKYIKRKKTF